MIELTVMAFLAGKMVGSAVHPRLFPSSERCVQVADEILHRYKPKKKADALIVRCQQKLTRAV